MTSSFSQTVKGPSSKTDVGRAFLKPDSQVGERSNFSPTGAGFDLTQVPARPSLETGPRVQCCAKDGGSCSCPKCQEAAERERNGGGGDEEQSVPDTAPAEQSMVSEAAPEQNAVPETSSPVESPESSSETDVTAEASSSGLIVEDSVAGLQEGQMKKTQFLQQLRESICSTIEPVLARVGQTTDGCPYLNYWLSLYQGKDAAQVERTVKKYAPDSVNAKTAEEYISIVSQRALKAAEIWAVTGKLSGVPEGVPTTLPNESSAPAASGNASGGNALQAKARSGEVRSAEDPDALQKDLGEGQPLSSDVRGRMESAFGTNFSNVRTHTDTRATEASDRVNARAFTVGNHVAFGNGEYRPGTMMGDALIAHELAHTIQQGGSNQAVDKMEVGSSGYNELEADADHTAAGIMGSLWGGDKKGGKDALHNILPSLRSGLRLQRCGKGNSPAPTAQAVTLKRTVTHPPHDDGCGGFNMGAIFSLDNADATTSGFVVQKVDFDLKRDLCAGGTDNFNTTYWEAWEVRAGKVFIGTSNSLHDSDGVGDVFQVPSTATAKGTNSLEGHAQFMPGFAEPRTWGNVPEALSLPSTKTQPAGWTNAGSINRFMKSTFDCCVAHPAPAQFTKQE